ncbi:hypothetical protein NQ315_013950 [Exocentrus adspersus]|uniref:Uncharacterized protein n=1 Tax=Exocentrus adspersus TaxID=1586481 RepID=A0AAV8VS85_9CUCU|nr:hypothetical protein NQ315_013950 [Exocentrus adspersus]
MDPKLQPPNEAPIQIEESYFTKELEEMDSEYDVSLNINQSMNPSKTSSVVRCSGDINNSVSSINTSILDDAEEVKALKEKVSELETKCKYLGNENQKLSNELTTQLNRNQKLERKLQFVKDNQEVFMRLKEAYINMKYNEAAGRKMIEIREKSIQTWEGILCRGCIQAEEMRRHVEGLREMYNDSFIIASYEMDQLVTTVKYLKDLIDRREKSWSSFLDRECKLQLRLKGLENENAALRNILKNRKINVDDLQNVESQSETISKDIIQLRKIIVKYEKRFRELEKNNTGLMKLPSPLNEKEKKIVHLIMDKYNTKLNKRSNDKLRSQSTSRDTGYENTEFINDLKFGTSCPKLSKSKSQISSTTNFKCGQKEGTAIMMMDELFNSDSKLI